MIPNFNVTFKLGPKKGQIWVGKNNKIIKITRVAKKNIYYRAYQKDKRWTEIIDTKSFHKNYSVYIKLLKSPPYFVEHFIDKNRPIMDSTHLV